MSGVRWFTDEDVYTAVAPAMRHRGFDAVSARESGRLGQSDEDQLQYAADFGYTLLTFNVAHFAAIHGAWLRYGRRHAGIVLSKQRPIGDLLARLTRIASALEPAAMHNRLEFLSDW